MKEKTHDLNHDSTFSAHTINCVCHNIRLMVRVLGINNFRLGQKHETNKKNTKKHGRYRKKMIVAPMQQNSGAHCNGTYFF